MMTEFVSGYLEIENFNPIKKEKILLAKAFSESLAKKPVKFIGISGSVSYEPSKEDDVDVFIISERGRLWTVILKSMIMRRFQNSKDICLSLFMEEEYAIKFFSKEMSPLKLNDAKMVIPLHGEEFYSNLLNKKETPKEETIKKINIIPFFLDFFIFVMLAPFIYIKTTINSHKDVREKGLSAMFRAKLSMKFFYLDSEKYRNIEREFNEGRNNG
ncbi:MAG: hypothetical protein ACYDAO_03320 [Thermoplasmataceae archaeon]